MKKLKLLLSNSFFLILIYFIGDYMYKFIAHRGNDDDLAENSKEAILNSLSKPYIDGVEFDIRITKDNKFVINHNATINLNSNKIGTIKNMTLKQLKEVFLRRIARHIEKRKNRRHLYQPNQAKAHSNSKSKFFTARKRLSPRIATSPRYSPLRRACPNSHLRITS